MYRVRQRKIAELSAWTTRLVATMRDLLVAKIEGGGPIDIEDVDAIAEVAVNVANNGVGAAAGAADAAAGAAGVGDTEEADNAVANAAADNAVSSSPNPAPVVPADRSLGIDTILDISQVGAAIATAASGGNEAGPDAAAAEAARSGAAAAAAAARSGAAMAEGGARHRRTKKVKWYRARTLGNRSRLTRHKKSKHAKRSNRD
jgi:hypothetical protein